MTDRDPILVEREKTHGRFELTAACAQDIKYVFRKYDQHPGKNMRAEEALDLIATKLARVVCGDQMNKDTWLDIAGYAKLGAEACE